jgi:transcriptional regulator with XRE-family HTH domain
MLVSIEQGSANPSIATLLLISDALGIGLWDWTLGPGEGHSTEAHAAGTLELLLVLDGQVKLTVG